MTLGRVPPAPVPRSPVPPLPASGVPESARPQWRAASVTYTSRKRSQVAVRTFENAWHARGGGPPQRFQAHLREGVTEIGTRRRDHASPRNAPDARDRTTPGRCPRNAGTASTRAAPVGAGGDAMPGDVGQRRARAHRGPAQARSHAPGSRSTPGRAGRCRPVFPGRPPQSARHRRRRWCGCSRAARPLRGPKPGQPRKQRRQAGRHKRRQHAVSQAVRHDRRRRRR